MTEEDNNEGEEAEEFVELDLEALTDLTHSEEDYGENGFFSPTLPARGDFVAPVLTPDETPTENPEINLEDATQRAPGIAPPVPGTLGMPETGTNYTSPGLYEEEQRTYERLEDQQTRFEPGGGLTLDAARIGAGPIVNPFTRREEGGERGMGERDELAEFTREQQKYQEIKEEEQALPFRRGERRRTKVFK